MYVDEIEIYKYTVLKTMNCMGCKYTYNICVNLGRLTLTYRPFFFDVESDRWFSSHLSPKLTKISTSHSLYLILDT